jgi:RHS repeat-associated protein
MVSTYLVETINYQDGKTVTFGYNKNGILKTTEDWTGAMTFELDLLGRIKSANDQNNKTTSYTYDAVGNKETMTYPDNKVVTYGYDALNRMKTVTDGENQVTTYDYDKASRVTGMTYPNGWKELNVYDDAGQVLTVHDQSPGNTVKNLKFQYAYDNNGNVTREYRRGTGLGQKKEDYTHVYDDLNRLTQTSGLYGKTQTNYTYDTLSNLTFEQSGTTKTVDYDYNSLNQQISKIVNNKDQYTNTFDKRGNLTQVTYNTKNRVEESYVYDATNRMVKGTNAIGEESAYLYTGLGDLIQNTWTVKKNAYGYHDVQLTTAVTGEDTTIIRDTPTSTTGKKKDVATPEQVAADMTLNQTSTIQKTYVIDYTSMYKDAIMETETGGLTYRYTYGLEKLSVVVSPIEAGAGSIVQNGTVKLYYHKDRLGNTDYLTDNVQGKAVSYVDYDAWGNPLKKAVLKMGLRELDLIKDYTGHQYDQVIGQYYAKARMYDSEDRRFMAVDPVKGSGLSPITLNPYVYVMDNPMRYTDPTGRIATDETTVDGHASLIKRDNNYYYDKTKRLPNLQKSNVQNTVGGANQGYYQVTDCQLEVVLPKFDVNSPISDDIKAILEGVHNNYVTVGTGVILNADLSLLKGGFMIMYFDRDSFGSTADVKYESDNHYYPFVYTVGEVSVSFEDFLKAEGLNTKIFKGAKILDVMKPSLSLSLASAMKKVGYDDFAPVDLNGGGEGFNGAAFRMAIESSERREGYVIFSSVGYNPVGFDLGYGASGIELINKSETDRIFEAFYLETDSNILAK